MKALLIVLLLLFLLGLLKVGVHIVWDGGAAVQLLIWKFRISFPRKKASKKRDPGKESDKAPAQAKQDALKTHDLFQAALANWREILALIGKAVRTPRLDVLELRLTAGGRDAADCALNYGRLWAAAGGILPVLENTFRIGKREIDVRCDYNQKEISCFAQVDLTVRIYELLILGVLGLKLLARLYHDNKLTQKAVQSS